MYSFINLSSVSGRITVVYVDFHTKRFYMTIEQYLLIGITHDAALQAILFNKWNSYYFTHS